jgi:hypothetical protein
MNLTNSQRELIESPLSAHIFIEGPAGTGKTTAAVARLQRFLDVGVPGNSILILLPQRTLGTPFLNAITSVQTPPGGIVTLLTAGGFAQRMIELYWPLIAGEAGFAQPNAPPKFLTLETAQYHMAKLVTPLLEQGYFESVVIERNRLFSQILDSLNKSALVGFPYTEIGDRLKAAWVGSPGQLRVFDDAQTCTTKFRQHCLENNLLDFSLQIDVFWKHVRPLQICRNLFTNTYRHVIADNIEEDTPFAHNLLAEWLPNLDSTLLIFDSQAGYRRFLGADPDGAYLLKEYCTTHVHFSESHVISSSIEALSVHFEHSLFRQPPPPPSGDPRPAIEFHTSRYYPQMLDWVTDRVCHLIRDKAVHPSEIVILAPYLSDALRYALTNRLENNGISTRSRRPSRSLREEPVTRALLTLAKLAHPNWDLTPSKSDLAYALMQTIEGMDLVRSHLLADIVFRNKLAALQLQSFDHIIPSAQERITYLAGERYERLRKWLESYRAYPPLELDHFLAALFGEVLSQPGFRFHSSFDAGTTTARLIESIQKFRRVASTSRMDIFIPPGQEYIQMVEQGVIAAQYLVSWQSQPVNAVLLTPAYTFLMGNYPVTIQFWLDIASRSWSERLAQPLTHPYVLSRTWPRDKVWTDTDEVGTSLDSLYTLVTGLLHRCRQQLFLGLSDLSEQGYEQRGPLLKVINRILQTYVGQ